MIKKLYEIGNWYAFKITKIINITEDCNYFILKDINNNKFLLPAEFYDFYNLFPGRIIICRIDKINCNGKIFLEPFHPYYREGKIYDFKFERYDKKTDKKTGLYKSVMVVRDFFDNEAIVMNIITDLKKPGLIRCRVGRIKKGRLILFNVQ